MHLKSMHCILYLISHYLIVLGGLWKWQSMPPVCVCVSDVDEATKDSGAPSTAPHYRWMSVTRDDWFSVSAFISQILKHGDAVPGTSLFTSRQRNDVLKHDTVYRYSLVYRQSRRRQDSRMGRGFETLANLILLRLKKWTNVLFLLNKVSRLKRVWLFLNMYCTLPCTNY